MGGNPLLPIESALSHMAYVHLSPKAAHRWQIGGISWIKASQVVPGGECSSNELTTAAGQYDLADGETIRIYSSESPSEFLGVSQVEKQLNSDGFVLRARRFV